MNKALRSVSEDFYTIVTDQQLGQGSNYSGTRFINNGVISI